VQQPALQLEPASDNGSMGVQTPYKRFSPRRFARAVRDAFGWLT